MSGPSPVLMAPLLLEALAARRGAPGCRVERLGMGPGRAQAAAARLQGSIPSGSPAVVLGVAGALVEGARPGEVVVASELSSTTGGSSVPLRSAAEVAELLSLAGLSVLQAPVVSSPTIVSGAQARLDAASGGAVAVDMESYWCLPLSADRPFAVVRVVLDIPGRDLWSPASLPAAAFAFRALVRSARALARWSPAGAFEPYYQKVGDL